MRRPTAFDLPVVTRGSLRVEKIRFTVTLPPETGGTSLHETMKRTVRRQDEVLWAPDPAGIDLSSPTPPRGRG